MTEKERDAIKKLTDISRLLRDTSKDVQLKERFLEEFGVEIGQIDERFLSLLNESYNIRNAEDVSFCIFVGFVFDLYSVDYIDILCKLLEADWHYSHEDIASILQKLKDPNSVSSLYKTTLTVYPYLDCSDVSPLAVKCIWALGGILTEDAKEKLRLLAQSDNEIIRENAIKQLERQQ